LLSPSVPASSSRTSRSQPARRSRARRTSRWIRRAARPPPSTPRSRRSTASTSPTRATWRPNYGVGATEFLGVPASAANIAELKNRIRRTLAADPAVDQVDDPRVTIAGDGSGLIEIDVAIRVAGQGQRFQLAIRRT
jgi:hypothetical protein